MKPRKLLFALLPCLWIGTASSQGWVLGLGGAIDVPFRNWNPAYTFGYGSHLDLGIRVDPLVTLGLSFDLLQYSGTGPVGDISNTDLRFLAGIRHYFAEEGWRPYGIAQAGLAVQLASSTGGNDTNLNFDGSVGWGMEAGLGKDVALFLEARLDLMPAEGMVGQDLPIGLGVRMGL